MMRRLFSYSVGMFLLLALRTGVSVCQVVLADSSAAESTLHARSGTAADSGATDALDMPQAAEISRALPTGHSVEAPSCSPASDSMDVPLPAGTEETATETDSIPESGAGPVVCFSCWWWDLLLGAGFAFIGVVFALWYERQGAPRLYFSIAKHSDAPRHGFGRCRFLYVSVSNRPKKRWAVRQDTAYSCHGHVVFQSLEGDPLSGAMPIRWAGNPEPLRTEWVGKQPVEVLDRLLMRMSRFMDIAPGESASVDTVVRIGDDPAAYGWTADSYRYSWKHPDFKFEQDEFIAELTLFTGDSSFTAKFKVRNSASLDSFELLPVED